MPQTLILYNQYYSFLYIQMLCLDLSVGLVTLLSLGLDSLK